MTTALKKIRFLLTISTSLEYYFNIPLQYFYTIGHNIYTKNFEGGSPLKKFNQLKN